MREHAELMGQLKESFRSDHDVQGVQQVTTAMEEMSTAFAKRQKNASTAVAGRCCKEGKLVAPTLSGQTCHIRPWQSLFFNPVKKGHDMA